MGFKTVQDLDASVTIAIGGVNKKTGKKNPTSAEGFYLGSRQIDSTKSKTGKCYLHVLQTSKGNVGVWGKTDMDRKVTTVPLGTMVRITHTHMQATKNGEMYKYQVEIDSDNTIEVDPAGTEPSSFQDSNEVENEYSAQQEEENEDDADEYDSAAATATLAAAQARKTKVQELLNSKSKK